MQKAIEALEISLSEVTWESRMEDLVNILDSYEWQSRGEYHYGWTASGNDTNEIILALHIGIHSDKIVNDISQDGPVFRKERFSKQNSYWMEMEFKAFDDSLKVLPIEESFYKCFGGCVVLNSLHGIQTAIRTLKEIQMFLSGY
jgi:hypothetical protein